MSLLRTGGHARRQQDCRCKHPQALVVQIPRGSPERRGPAISSEEFADREVTPHGKASVLGVLAWQLPCEVPSSVRPHAIAHLQAPQHPPNGFGAPNPQRHDHLVERSAILSQRDRPPKGSAASFCCSASRPLRSPGDASMLAASASQGHSEGWPRSPLFLWARCESSPPNNGAWANWDDPHESPSPVNGDEANLRHSSSPQGGRIEDLLRVVDFVSPQAHSRATNGPGPLSVANRCPAQAQTLPRAWKIECP